MIEPEQAQDCRVKIIYMDGFMDNIPFFRGVPLKASADNKNLLENLNIRGERTDLLEPGTDHFNVEKNEKIHQDVVKQIQKICPQRDEWVRLHPTYRPPTDRVQTAAGAKRSGVPSIEPSRQASRVRPGPLPEP